MENDDFYTNSPDFDEDVDKYYEFINKETTLKNRIMYFNRGRIKGRKRIFDHNLAAELAELGVKTSKISKLLGVKRQNIEYALRG